MSSKYSRDKMQQLTGRFYMKRPVSPYPNPKDPISVTPFTRENTAIIAGPQTPVLRYAGHGIWHLYLSYSRDFSAGTYLRLLPDGRIFSDTRQPDGRISTATIKSIAVEPEIYALIQKAKRV